VLHVAFWSQQMSWSLLLHSLPEHFKSLAKGLIKYPSLHVTDKQLVRLVQQRSMPEWLQFLSSQRSLSAFCLLTMDSGHFIVLQTPAAAQHFFSSFFLLQTASLQ
jgi:hypothetical protein